MTLNDIKTALLTVTSKVYHFKSPKPSGNYIVWAEDGQAGSLHADNKMKAQVITGTIDYFTKDDGDQNFNKIQQALNGIEVSWSLNSIQYEDDTGYIHYEWVWEYGNDSI